MSKFFGVLFVAILSGIISGIISSLFVWLFWNAVMPEVFGLPSLTILQAFLLTGVCHGLFPRSTSSASKS